MKLHQDFDKFNSSIQDISHILNISPSFIEKDYWIFLALKHIKNGRFGNDVVFKGGTSLSKGHKIVHRFSEDIDLTLDSASHRSETGTFTKDLVKRNNSKIKNDLIENFLPVDSSDLLREKGELKTIPLDYSPQFPSGEVKPNLIVELSAIDFDTPNKVLPISSFITDYLIQNNRNDLIELYGLQPFDLKVVNVEKTLCEKIFRLNKRGAMEGIDGIGLKLRDVYDISTILGNAAYLDYISSDAFIKDLVKVELAEIKKIEDWTKSLIERGDKDRAKTITEKHVWMHQPISDSLIFARPQELLSIKPSYKESLDRFIFGEPVMLQQMIEPVQTLSAQLRRYDKEMGRFAQQAIPTKQKETVPKSFVKVGDVVSFHHPAMNEQKVAYGTVVHIEGSEITIDSPLRYYNRDVNSITLATESDLHRFKSEVRQSAQAIAEKAKEQANNAEKISGTLKEQSNNKHINNQLYR